MDGRTDGDSEKIVLCGIIGHQPLWGHCLKGQTDRWMDIQIDKYLNNHPSILQGIDLERAV